MNRRTKAALGGGLAVALAVTAGIAIAAGEDDAEAPITGGPLEQASAVALDHTGGGGVTGSEVGDEEGYYEIEVTLDDGREVDVHLDESFAVLGSEAEGDDAGEAADD